MTGIKKLYLLSHTHTDLGFTDHLAAVRLHHRDILERALEVCEESIDEPQGTQHRWTCELTSTTLDYLRHTSPANIDRFLALYKTGRIAVAGMRYHWTPLVTKPLAIHTLKDIDALRDEFGITVRSAMQCDVNGLAWFWNGLLQSKGIDFLSMHQNPHRGYWGEHLPSAWHWEDRAGGSILVHQGEHYGLGGGYLRLGRPGQQDKKTLFDILDRHALSDRWPYDFSVINVTNTANGDNVFPESYLSAAVQDWNSREAVQMEIATIDQIGDLLRAVPDLPVRRGEWMDSWGDGVASTPLETAAARTAERLIPVIEALGEDEQPVLEQMLDSLALYDEHTWGAHSATTAPENIFAASQQIQKSQHAFEALALAMRLVARRSRVFFANRANGPLEGDCRFDERSHPDKGPDVQAYIVANLSDHPMEVDWPVPLDRGAGPQTSIPQSFAFDAFFPGIGEDGWTDAMLDDKPSGSKRLKAHLAPQTAQILVPTAAATTDCSAGDTWIENVQCRVELCPHSGGIKRWFDKTTGSELVDPARPIFGPEMQFLRAEFVRREIFEAPYWERQEKEMGWNKADLFRDGGKQVRLEPGTVDPEGATIHAISTFESGYSVDTRFRLAPDSADLRIQGEQRAIGSGEVFSINWPVGFAPPHRRLWIDTGDGLVDALADQLPTSSTRWQLAQTGIAFKGDDGTAISVAALDTPLFQPAGPWTSEPFVPPTRSDFGVFWGIHTHWDTNFPDRVRHLAPARFVLRHCPSGPDEAEIALAQACAVPIIVRAPEASPSHPFPLG